MKCQNCRFTVTRKSKFCPKCGERIIGRRSSQEGEVKPKIPVGYALGLISLGILMGFAVFKFSSKPANSARQTSPGFQGKPSFQSAAVADIASELMCPCGSCSDPLEPCQCEHPRGALEVKGFIAQKLQEGHKKPHIIEMVYGEYGDVSKGLIPAINPELPEK